MTARIGVEMYRNQEEWVILGITLEGEAFTYPN